MSVSSKKLAPMIERLKCTKILFGFLQIANYEYGRRFESKVRVNSWIPLTFNIKKQ